MPTADARKYISCDDHAFAPSYTMASVIANEFTEATGELYLAALAEVGLLLFGVTVALNVFARLLVWRVGKLPEGGRL